MKLCVSATGNDLGATVDPRFGRCQFFIFIDSDTMTFEPVANPAFTAGGGAGILAAQLVVNKGAEVMLTGNVGPNAFQALQAAGMKVVTGVFGSIRDVVELFKRGDFHYTEAPTVGSHFGMGR
jgi:predicted Fe-Mo cluster-binding NifX family protein